MRLFHQVRARVPARSWAGAHVAHVGLCRRCISEAGSGRNPATALEPNIAVVYRIEESWRLGGNS